MKKLFSIRRQIIFWPLNSSVWSQSKCTFIGTHPARKFTTGTILILQFFCFAKHCVSNTKQGRKKIHKLHKMLPWKQLSQRFSFHNFNFLVVWMKNWTAQKKNTTVKNYQNIHKSLTHTQQIHTTRQKKKSTNSLVPMHGMSLVTPAVTPFPQPTGPHTAAAPRPAG